MGVAHAALAARLLEALPQTQCRRCGYADCAAYAEAIAGGTAAIDRCPPGGAEGIARLARLVGDAAEPPSLDPTCGAEAPRRLAWIDEPACIGCALCLKACPVDAIVGASRRTHTVVAPLCSGCELCLPVCPVDCIRLVPGPTGDATGWAAWSSADAAIARARYDRHGARVGRNAAPADRAA